MSIQAVTGEFQRRFLLLRCNIACEWWMCFHARNLWRIEEQTVPACSHLLRTISTGACVGYRRALELRWLLPGVLFGLLAGGASYANPTGHSVASGSAQFARPDANTLNVTTSSNAIINWQGFSIDSGEVTRFTQPSATSAVLNRVTGSDASSILGELVSNGRVFLVNPNGIVFGEDAVVDTAGLVASTLGIADADFLAGRYEFEAGTNAGDIENQGLIKSGAGGVFLLAPSIENSGVIETDGGDLVLAAGRTIKLTSLDLDGVQVEVQASEDEALNLGELIAKRGAAGVFAGSIRNSGTVEANAVTVDDDGTIRLVAQGDITLESSGRIAAEGPSGGEIRIESESGTTSVSGEVSAKASEGEGGTIHLLGEQVGLDGATVDASGPTGGGEVLVGGDESGEGDIPTAESTYVSSDSTVSADALTNGDGGRVIVFAEGFANVQGKLSARGGPEGGDGGFVETSGLESLSIAHTPDTTAPKGDGGEWLIDPNDIEIVPGGGSVHIDDSSPFESTDDSATIGIELIIAALSGGQTVTVRTNESGGNRGIGHITVNAALDIERTSGTNTLVLDASGGVSIYRPITDSADGAVLNLVLDSGDGDETVMIHDDITLLGGSLRTEGNNRAQVSNNATITLDGATWHMNSFHLLIGDDGFADGPGRVVLRNGAILEGPGSDSDLTIAVGGSLARGDLIIQGGSAVNGFSGMVIGVDGSEGTVTVTDPGSSLELVAVNIGYEGGAGTLNIENGGGVMAQWVVVGGDPETQGTLNVTGSGSALTTAGTGNTVTVGGDGFGVLNVVDGGLVETLTLNVANSGDGRAVIRGVASDGTRSRIIASPANGKFSGIYANSGGSARVGRNAGSSGRLEILEGGLLRIMAGDGTYGPSFTIARNNGSEGTVVIDGAESSLEVIQNGPAVHDDPDNWAGPAAQLARRGGATVIIRNGGTFLLRGEAAFVRVSRDSTYERFTDPDAGPITQPSVVRIESGGRMELDGDGARFVIGDSGPAADGTVIVTGPGSTLVTKGDNNAIIVGDEGTGTLHVLDGGVVDTLFLDIGRSAVGRAVIRGVASDGTRSRIIVSPAHGKFSGDFEDEGGFARLGRNAGSHGHLEILEGGLLRVLDGDGTHGPGLQLARHKGSAGTLLIDGEGSLVEIVQEAPAVHGNPQVSPGPFAYLARRGGGTTTIRNGGRLVVRGESGFVQVSRDSFNEEYPDPDTGPIDQSSVVRVESGGRIEIDGEDASMVVGGSGPAADGDVTVTGSGSTLALSGTGNRIVVGDEGGTGRLEVLDGAAARFGELVVGINGTTNLSTSDAVQEEIDEILDEILPEEEGQAEEEDEEDEESEETAESGEGEEQDEEELSECPL